MTTLLIYLLQTLLNEQDRQKIVSEDYKTTFLQDATTSKIKTTTFYFNDAGKLRALTAEIAQDTAAHYALQQILAKYKDDVIEREAPMREQE
jgi:hypothetical protein